jgi:very-short-patch-repair endonuclease
VPDYRHQSTATIRNCGQGRGHFEQNLHIALMRARQTIPESVVRLAGAQSGVLSRAQALGLGVNRKSLLRLLADGQWETLVPGIYLVPGVRPCWLAHVWAGILLGGSGSRTWNVTAAALQGLLDEQRLPVQILVPNGLRPVPRAWAVFSQERDGVRARSSRAEPPRTRVEDTVLDLCASGSEEACVDWVTTAVQRRLTTPEALRDAVVRRGRLRHRAMVMSLLHVVDSGVESPLEFRYFHNVERAHGLVAGARQRQRPGRNGYIDVLYEEFAVVVELDGRVGHVGASDAFRDRRRDNSHTAVGLRTLRFGWREVTGDPCGVAAEVAEVLIGLGWGGFPARCPRCR